MLYTIWVFKKLRNQTLTKNRRSLINFYVLSQSSNNLNVIKVRFNFVTNEISAERIRKNIYCIYSIYCEL